MAGLPRLTHASTDRSTPVWTVAIALKPLRLAKSRLGHDLVGFDRRSLALAMASDVVRAVTGSRLVGRCLVVTADDAAAAELRGLGADILGEPHVIGLNAAFERARDHLADGPLALLTADLPALTTDELDHVLAHLDAEPSDQPGLVADRAGTGTTMLAARSAGQLIPQFGAASRQRHVAAGAVDHSRHGGDGLRRDVDTLEDLLTLGILGTAGVATTSWLNVATHRRLA